MTGEMTAMVREFHEVFGLGNAPAPTLGTRQLRELRQTLVDEEVAELAEALGLRRRDGREGPVPAPDLVAIADALGDIAYVVHGAALEFGIDLDAVVAEIHASNMRKRWPDGSVRHRADGKVLKPPGWQGPDLDRVLGQVRPCCPTPPRTTVGDHRATPRPVLKEDDDQVGR